MSIKVQIRRFSTSDQGTLGTLHIIGEWFGCYTIELPWRDNRQNVSCIPAGEYPIVPFNSDHFGETYVVKEVPNRFGILFHSGNVAGDESKGFRTHSAGCILPGKQKGGLWGQRAVLMSRPTVRRLKDALDEREGTLEIRNDYKP